MCWFTYWPLCSGKGGAEGQEAHLDQWERHGDLSELQNKWSSHISHTTAIIWRQPLEALSSLINSINWNGFEKFAWDSCFGSLYSALGWIIVAVWVILEWFWSLIKNQMSLCLWFWWRMFTLQRIKKKLIVSLHMFLFFQLFVQWYFCK